MSDYLDLSYLSYRVPLPQRDEDRECIATLRADLAAARAERDDARAEVMPFVPDQHGGHMLSPTGDKWYPESYAHAQTAKFAKALRDGVAALAAETVRAHDAGEGLLPWTVGAHERMQTALREYEESTR